LHDQNIEVYKATLCRSPQKYILDYWLLPQFFVFRDLNPWLTEQVIRSDTTTLKRSLHRVIGKPHSSLDWAGIIKSLYLSYTLIWIANCALLNSLVLWITLNAMAAFYTVSAKREEAAIWKASILANTKLIKIVGMFLPRVTKWKPRIRSFSETPRH
jgi:hypothetical protein